MRCRFGRTRLPVGLSVRNSTAAPISVMPDSNTTNSTEFFLYPMETSCAMVVSCTDVGRARDLRLRDWDAAAAAKIIEELGASSRSSSESHQDWPGGIEGGMLPRFII